MFLLPKSFEHTIRSPIIPATPAQPGSGLNPEFHKGCTGKAHACGTIKAKIQKLNTTAKGDKTPRKSSMSSETISDSGSENSSMWPHCSTDGLITANQTNGKMLTKTDSILKSHARESLANNSKLTKTLGNKSPVAARRLLKNTPSPVLSRKTSTTITGTRTRLHSEGDKNFEGGRQSPSSNSVSVPLSTFERTQKYRSFRTTGKSKANSVTVANNSSHIRPPWNSAASGAKPQYAMGNMATNAGILLTNRAMRSSIRRRSDTIQWQLLWERSLHMRSYGSTGNSGLHKNYDETIRKKCHNANELQQEQHAQEGSVNKYAAANDGNVNDRVWLVHRGGFCAALRLPQTKAHLENHKVVIQLLHNSEEMTVDEDDVEKMNSPSLDLIEDICELKHLNEASLLHCLRQRYASNLIYTKAGPILLVVNPMAPLSLYSEKVVSMFRGCKTEDMPPHIYSLAQTAYRTMLETRRDQSLVFMGRSGSGKTTSFKHALYYLALAAGCYYNNFLNAEKVNSVNAILEAFGNTKTCLNSNATRLTQLLSLDFDQTGQIASASIQVLLPERQRAGRRLPNERSFHIMTRLLAGACGSLQKELHLESIPSEDNHPFVSLPQKLEDRQRSAAEFVRTVQAFETLNINPRAVRGIWSILASIYHLGLAGVTIVGSGPTARTQFANPSAARRAAALLGVSLEDLSGAAFNVNASGSSSPSKTLSDIPDLAWECLEALVIGLYSEALAAAIALINKAICTSAHTIASIILIDTPGFQNPASCGSQTGATLSDLKHNYLQERLQLLFHHNTLVAPRDRYAQELVEIETEGMSDTNPGPLVSLIDKAPQNHVVRSSQRDLREQDRRGLLWLLDEESIYPNSNDDTFLERLFSHYGDREHQTLLRKCNGSKQFVLQHLQGTNPVLYMVNGWVRNSREHPAIRNAGSLLQDSSRDEISRLYIGSLTRSSGGIVFCGSFAGLEGTHSLRRVSSIRRSFTSAGVKRNSIMLQVKFTVDGIIDTLRRTGTHFVHCYLLQHNAGQQPAFSASGSPNTSVLQTSSEELVNIPLLRSQLRGSQVLEAARLHRFGYPESVPLNEFERRFGLLAGESYKDVTVEQILSVNELDPATYRIGPSQVSVFMSNSFMKYNF
ncbi:hypothetical protein GQX74_000274 [Glossina fuscipes]|nr:hypothetical protein GQX74_000274 [Glossina fuscipes]